jgi:heme-degrading monooxygenase HmoA
MWVQMLKTRVKSGQEATVEQLPQEMDERMQREGQGAGPKRVMVLQDQQDPRAYFTLLFFESEAKAREYEGSPEQEAVKERMMQIWEGPPQFTDLNLVHEGTR